MLSDLGVGAFDDKSSWVTLRRARTPLTVSNKLPWGCVTVTFVGGFGGLRSAPAEGRVKGWLLVGLRTEEFSFSDTASFALEDWCTEGRARRGILFERVGVVTTRSTSCSGDVFGAKRPLDDLRAGLDDETIALDATRSSLARLHKA
jgi:hypothetical protein